METKTRLFARGSGTKQKVFSSKEKNVMFRWHLHVTCSVFLLGQLSAACTVSRVQQNNFVFSDHNEFCLLDDRRKPIFNGRLFFLESKSDVSKNFK